MIKISGDDNGKVLFDEKSGKYIAQSFYFRTVCSTLESANLVINNWVQFNLRAIERFGTCE